MATGKEREKGGKSFLGKMASTIRGNGGKERDRTKLPSSDASSIWSGGGDSSHLNLDLDVTSSFGRSTSPTILSPATESAAAAAAAADCGVAQRLTDDQVETMFESFIEDMNIKGDKAAPLRAKSINEKRSMLKQMNRTFQSERGGKVKSDSSSDYIRLLNVQFESPEKLQKILESLRVALTSNPVSWMQQFAESTVSSTGLNGLDLILEHLRLVSVDINYGSLASVPAQLECLRCLRAFMNNRYGFLKMIEHTNSYKYLVMSMNPAAVVCLRETMNLLAAMCVFCQDGEFLCFNQVLDAFTVIGDSEQRERFQPIIWGLLEQGDLQLKIASLQLINAMLTAAEDVDLRFHLRSELTRIGLVDVIDDLEKTGDARVTIQLDVFKRDREHDFEELCLRGDNLRSEFDTVSGCVRLLENTVSETPSAPFLLSIMQHLLLIRDDPMARPAYYCLIDEAVSQIVLYKNGCDPDFRTNRRFEVDVDLWLEKVAETGAVFEIGDGAGAKVLQKKLDIALTACQEEEAKLRQIYAKIDEYQSEVAGLREHITSKGDKPLPNGTTPPPPYAPRKLSLETTVSSSAGIPPPPPPPPPIGGIPPPPPPPPPGSGIPPPPPPPPPPPGPGGVPPPPPPPPGLGGAGAGPRFPGPPPPPGQMPPAMALVDPLPPHLRPKRKFDHKADVTLKKMNWRTITPKRISIDSFWTNTHEETLADPNFFQEINSLFAIGGPKQKGQSAESASAASAASTSKKPSKKAKVPKVLESNAAHILSILQGSLKMSHDEMRRAILDVNEDKLAEATLQQLIQSLPEGEQVSKLNEYKDRLDELTDVEQFALKLCSIKSIKPRLRSICFKLKFKEMVEDVEPDIVHVSAACDDVLDNEGFKNFLELLLLVGNYMNAGSKNSDAFGFDISFLTKLLETKSVNGSTKTLLHFLVQTMERKFPHLANFTADLCHVQRASKVSSSILQKNLESVQQAVKRLDGYLKTFQPQDETDRFRDVMDPFHKEASQKCAILETMDKNMRRKYDELAKYFTFDPKKYSADEMFGDLCKFKEHYDQVQKDLAKQREQEERQRRAEEAKAQAEAEKKERKEQQKSIARAINQNGDTGVVDSLLEALNSGQAYPQRIRTPNKRAPRSSENRTVLSRQRSRVYPEAPPRFARQGQNTGVSVDEFESVAIANNNNNNNDIKNKHQQQNQQPQMRVRRKGQPAQNLIPQQQQRENNSGDGPISDNLLKEADELMNRLKNL